MKMIANVVFLVLWVSVSSKPMDVNVDLVVDMDSSDDFEITITDHEQITTKVEKYMSKEEKKQLDSYPCKIKNHFLQVVSAIVKKEYESFTRETTQTDTTTTTTIDKSSDGIQIKIKTRTITEHATKQLTRLEQSLKLITAGKFDQPTKETVFNILTPDQQSRLEQIIEEVEYNKKTLQMRELVLAEVYVDSYVETITEETDELVLKVQFQGSQDDYQDAENNQNTKSNDVQKVAEKYINYC